MVIEDLLAKRGMTKYKLAVQAGIPHPTLSDICSGKAKLEKCSAETVYKLSQVLGVSMEQLTEDGIRQTERERAYEYGLPDYLQHDLDAYKSGIKNHSSLLDCLWGELYGSINMAEINFGFIFHHNFSYPPLLNPLLISLHDNKPVYRLQQQSIRRLAFVPPYSVFCSISFRCGGLSIERNQKPLTPENTLALAHHDKQKQVEVKRSSRANPHEFRLFSGCPYAVVK